MAIAFRKKAQAKQSSPEQLDETVQTIWPMRRIAVYAFGSAIAFALIWSIFGRLPDSGRGQGILVASNSIVPVQSQADGQVGHWSVKVGDIVKKGDVLGILEQPVIERQLQQSEAKIDEVKSQQKQLRLLRDTNTRLQKESYRRQRDQLRRRIDYLTSYIEKSRTLANQINDINNRLLEIQKSNAVTARSVAVQLTKDLSQRLEAYQRLRAENLASEDTLRSTRQRYEDSQVHQKELNLQEQQLSLTRVQTDQSFLDARTDIASDEHTLTDLNVQLQELDAREAAQDKTDSEARIKDENQVDDLRRTIEKNQQQLQRNREITSDFDGRVLEVTAGEGTLVSFGQRLLQLDTRQPNQELIAVAYFQDNVGKYLTAGMPAHVAPSTVDQSHYGSIRGVISSVSNYPISPEAAVNAVGNQEVAANLTKYGYQIEAQVRLERNSANPSGFAWTSRTGPDIEITSGTTTAVLVTYQERAPISFILPKLREWSGLAISIKDVLR
jgi:HlyD family secretion protein